MQVVFEPSLLEEAIDQAIRPSDGDGELFRQFMELTEQAYRPSATGMKEEVFQYAYEYIASKLEYRKKIKRVAAGFDLLSNSVAQIIIRKPEGLSEGADVVFAGPALSTGADNLRRGVAGPGNTHTAAVVLEVRPARLNEDTFYSQMLPHEFLRAQDMLDPRFQYAREPLDGLTAAQENIIRSRYGALWDAYIWSRLKARDPSYYDATPQLIERLSKAFCLDGADSRKALTYINSSHDFTHKKLFGCARDPAALMREIGAAQSKKIIPGSQCSICSFPSYSLSQVSDTDILSAIKAEFGDADISSGVCERCIEYFSVKLGLF